MVQIKQSGASTAIEVDGIDLSKYASEFTLTQKVGEIPVLKVTIPVSDIEAELPNCATVVEKEAPRKE